jgi:ribonuclease T2
MIARSILCTLPLFALATGFAPMALAQTAACHLPASVAAPLPAAPDGPVRVLPITSYTLAITWAPEFCSTHGADPAAAAECAGAAARFGFALHGLWPDSAPENGRASWPQWCPAKPPASTQVPAAVVRSMLCTTPSPSLIAHEWAKHGTCMTRSPQLYFAKSRTLFEALHFPDMAALARRADLTAGDLRRAFATANPRYPITAIGLMLRDGATLQEVHLCHDRRLRPAPCALPDVADTAPLRITPPLRSANR